MWATLPVVGFDNGDRKETFRDGSFAVLLSRRVQMYVELCGAHYRDGGRSLLPLR